MLVHVLEKWVSRAYGINIIYFTPFLVWEDRHTYVLVWHGCFIKYLICSTFSMQRFKSTKGNFGFCTKSYLSRVPGHYTYLCLQHYTMRGRTCRCFCLVLVVKSTFQYSLNKDSRTQKHSLVHVPKDSLSRASGYQIYLCIQVFYYERTVMHVFC